MRAKTLANQGIIVVRCASKTLVSRALGCCCFLLFIAQWPLFAVVCRSAARVGVNLFFTMSPQWHTHLPLQPIPSYAIRFTSIPCLAPFKPIALCVLQPIETLVCCHTTRAMLLLCLFLIATHRHTLWPPPLFIVLSPSTIQNAVTLCVAPPPVPPPSQPFISIPSCVVPSGPRL